MWQKFTASTKKEALLLLRDKAGLAMLFIMPMALVFIMSLLQDSTLKKLEEQHTPVLIVNQDTGSFGRSIVEGLETTGFFIVTQQINGKTPTEEELRQLVTEGKYRVGIIIRAEATEALRNNIKYRIRQQFPEEERNLFEPMPVSDSTLPQVDVYFDPVTKTDFKHAVMSALQQFSAGVVAETVFDTYAKLLDDMVGIQLNQAGGFDKMISFTQQYATEKKSRIIPNSTQHNVPAWTIFAMFFIVIPLAGNIIHERESGLSMRLKTIPGSNLAVIMGKTVVYFIVGILQAAFMLLIGMYVLPLFGMPALKLGSGLMAFLILTISVSLAASGYGILIGTVATTQEQSSVFGSISVVILAAIGGIWVPTFMMSKFMVSVSKLSPLNWGLNGFYDIFLRNAGVKDIMHYVILLFSFFLVCISLSFLYNRYRKLKT